MSNEKTVEEFLAELENDQEYQQKRAAFKKRQEKREAELTGDEASILRDLGDLGIIIDSVWDLQRMECNYQLAMPVLIGHLSCDHLDWTKQGIVRALMREEAEPFTEALLGQFDKIEDPTSETKWLLGAAVGACCKTDFVPAVVQRCEDSRHGKARGEMPYALLRTKLDFRQHLERWVDVEDLAEASNKVLAKLQRKT